MDRALSRATVFVSALGKQDMRWLDEDDDDVVAIEYDMVKFSHVHRAAAAAINEFLFKLCEICECGDQTKRGPPARLLHGTFCISPKKKKKLCEREDDSLSTGTDNPRHYMSIFDAR